MDNVMEMKSEKCAQYHEVTDKKFAMLQTKVEKLTEKVSWLQSELPKNKLRKSSE